MSYAFVFPGQGSQHVGMGRALADAFSDARNVFAEVDDALSFDLSGLIWNGPEDELKLTENAQPALMAVSLAALRALQQAGAKGVGGASLVAGHSLGEYSALAAAGSLAIGDAARLLRLRGQAMQAAVPVGEGAMAALLGIELDVAREVASEAEAANPGSVCAPANDNAPGQVVISGSAGAVETAAEMARGRGARRAVMLPVSAPFHCTLMEPAADAMREALATVTLNAPARPVVSNVTASSESDPERVSELLVEQVTAMVRWRESVQQMASEGVGTLYEIGAGKVLSGLARRIDRSLDAIAIGEPEDIEAAIAALA